MKKIPDPKKMKRVAGPRLSKKALAAAKIRDVKSKRMVFKPEAA